jgi:23S rRNA (pseudouridine1915-N3)-methyltransferase
VGSAGSLALYWVGKRGDAAIESLTGEFHTRLARLVAFSEVRVRPAGGRGGDPSRVVAGEAAALRALLSPGDHVVALDERGRERTSEELASWLGGLLGRARRVVFLVGSDLGLDEGLKREANDLFALSRLTLPHQLARVLLLEQLYRALDLRAGGRYHRGTARESVV